MSLSKRLGQNAEAFLPPHSFSIPPKPVEKKINEMTREERRAFMAQVQAEVAADPSLREEAKRGIAGLNDPLKEQNNAEGGIVSEAQKGALNGFEREISRAGSGEQKG